jgi:hypothetical protein
MASRWMRPKLDKLKRDGAANARPANTKPVSRADMRAEMLEACKRYTGVVTVATTKPRETNTWRKRGGSLMGAGMGSAIVPDGRVGGVARNTNGNYYALWGTGDRLLKAR